MDMVRLALAAALIGLSAFATPAFAGKKDNSIRFASSSVLDNADPYFSNTVIAGILSDWVWDNLIYRDPRTGDFKPQLATAWKWIDDKTLEFELRRGVKWHNGAAFDADDVVYTVNFIANPANHVPSGLFNAWLDHAEKVDQYKVRIVSKQPSFAPAIGQIAENITPYPHEYYAKVGPQGMNARPIGSGPFRVVEHAFGKYIRMERNPDYYKDSPKSVPRVDKFEMRFIPDMQTQIAEMLTGSLDIIWNVDRDQAEQLRMAPNLQVVPGDSGQIAHLQLNSSDTSPAPPLRDIRVRKAIMHAIDRDTMVKSIVGEGARVMHTFCYPSSFGCTDEAAPRYAYDPAKAKQLLADAGFPNGFDIDIYAYRDRPNLEAIINYLRAVGIRANLRFVQPAVTTDAIRAGKVAMVYRNSGSARQDVSQPMFALFGGGPTDMNHDLELRDLIDRGNTSLDPTVREALYAKALALIQERAYDLPLYTLPTYYVAAKDLVFTTYPGEMHFWEMSWK
jgi:peptide/nickel transport system substrate-binding protein